MIMGGICVRMFGCYPEIGVLREGGEIYYEP